MYRARLRSSHKIILTHYRSLILIIFYFFIVVTPIKILSIFFYVKKFVPILYWRSAFNDLDLYLFTIYYLYQSLYSRILEPFSSAISDMNRLSPRSQKQQLKQEIWFHGSVSRSEAESMLTRVNIFAVVYI